MTQTERHNLMDQYENAVAELEEAIDWYDSMEVAGDDDTLCAARQSLYEAEKELLKIKAMFPEMQPSPAWIQPRKEPSKNNR